MIKIISVASLISMLLYTPLLLALDIPGVLKYEAVVELSLPVSGVVNRVLVEEGETVEKDELLLELDDVPFKANLDKTAAELRLLKAELGAMKKEHQRNKELFERMVLSTVTLDGSELNLIRAESLWQAKKAEYARIEYDYEKSRLRAPFAGRIIERLVEPGQAIRSEIQAPVLFSLADTTGFIVEAEVDGDKIGSLAHGVVIEVRLSGKKFPAKIKSITLLAPGRSLAQPARYRVRVKLEIPAENLRSGLPATLVLPGQYQ
ncbi:MAG: efflux RND transporter periplasmic adaptor subunit [Pseudomonadota bacterium]|nr:efflux RND transporter periplasmic adaptor subunit [Pseudomonadota bacterium]